MKNTYSSMLMVCGITGMLSCRTLQESAWHSRTLLEIDSKIQSAAYGPLWEDRQSRLAVIAADGRCLVAWREGEAWEHCEVHRTPGGLSAVAIGEADPDTPGPDLIVGGSTGQVVRISLRKTGDVLVKLIHEAGSPVGDIAVCDLTPAHPGAEVLVLTEDGRGTMLWRMGEDGRAGYGSKVVLTDTGRLRNAVAGPYGPQNEPCAYVAGFSGRLSRIYAVGGAFRSATVYEHSLPLARVAVGDVDPESRGPEIVLVDDGGQVTLLRQRMGEFIAETVHREEKALCGVAVADFALENEGEEIAVFGYGMEVALFTKNGEGYDRRVLFRDSDRGHWLLAGQLIPESILPEIVAMGYSGKCTLIHREYIPPKPP